MRADFISGALLASLAAGPIVSLPLIASGAVADPHSMLATIAFVPLMIVLSILFGFPISLIPNVLGSAVLAAAGKRHAGFRHPLVWAATGFALGTAIMTAVTGDLDRTSTVLGVVGVACALICRRSTIWSD